MGFQDILHKMGGQQGQDGGLATIQKLFDTNQMQGVMTKLTNSGMGQQVQSWVGKGQNQPISGADVERAVDPATLQQCAQAQGMSPDELSNHVAQALPEMVDQATPDGKMPSKDPFSEGMAGLKKAMHL
jgi:uncharacterized protein YidB (DUF937 family)